MHLAEQPRATRAERRPHRVFLLSLQAAREQQAGDVRARDEEDERHRAEQRHQQAAAVAIQHFLQQLHLRRQALEPRESWREFRMEPRRLGLCVFQGRGATDPADGVSVAAPRVAIRRGMTANQ